MSLLLTAYCACTACHGLQEEVAAAKAKADTEMASLALAAEKARQEKEIAEAEATRLKLERQSSRRQRKVVAEEQAKLAAEEAEARKQIELALLARVKIMEEEVHCRLKTRGRGEGVIWMKKERQTLHVQFRYKPPTNIIHVATLVFLRYFFIYSSVSLSLS